MQAKNVGTTPQKILPMSQIANSTLKNMNFLFVCGCFFQCLLCRKMSVGWGEEVANNNEKG